MSLTGSLSSALSGLNAAARAAEVVSSNVANAMTEGYGRRELETVSRSIGSSGQGVKVVGVTRHVDRLILGDRRLAEASVGDRTAQADFFRQLERVVGTSDSANSLAARITEFDSALIEAASRPESEARLSRVVDGARGIASLFANIGDEIQTSRSNADQQIANSVATLNSALEQVQELNSQVLANSGLGRDSSALQDQRQKAIDQIATIIPLREVQRAGGQIALFSTGGLMLLDGKAPVFEFAPAGPILPGMTQGSGALSGLSVNGRNISTDASAGPIAGGSLGAQFLIRDQAAPEMQAKLDAIARDLVERFVDPAVDPTISAGGAGLFTDAGVAFDPLNEIGLAQRLTLNSQVDPRQGGALWKLRDGLGAASQGPVGNSQQINALRAALSDSRTPLSGGFSAGAKSFPALATDLASIISTSRLSLENEQGFATARAETFRQLELADGVDSDQEMQTLLLVEQAYAANAKVIQTVGSMIQTLLEM